jgi:hypothetical protein
MLLCLALAAATACDSGSGPPASLPPTNIDAHLPPDARAAIDAAPVPGDTGAQDAPRMDVASLPDVDAPAADSGAGDSGVPDRAADAGPADAPAADSMPAVSQTPPQGARLLDAWLAAGHYRSWKCEPMAVSPRPGSPHGRNRVCSNDLASGHGSGPYPPGAASVKEIFFGSRIGVYAVSVKISAGTTGNAWYWYEQNDAEGIGTPGCAGCHSRAERAQGNDFVYIQVK